MVEARNMKVNCQIRDCVYEETYPDVLGRPDENSKQVTSYVLYMPRKLKSL